MKRNNLKPDAATFQAKTKTETIIRPDNELDQKEQELQELKARLKQEVAARKLLEQALLKSETKYQDLVENSTDLFARFDKNLRYVFINKSVEATFGIPREQAIGKTYEELGKKESLIGESRAKIREVFSTGQMDTCFVYLPTAEGLRCFHCTLQPEFNAAGEVEAVSSIGRDMTIIALKKQMLNHVFDNTKLGITAMHAVRDEEQRIIDFKWVLVNKRAETILALEASQLLNKSVLQVFPGVKEVGLFDLMVQVVEENKTHSQSFHYNYEHLNAWYDLLLSKLDDGIMLSFIDITEYRDLSLTLQKTNSELQREALERREAQEQLCHEHELLERIIENSIDCICALDASGRLTAWNKKIEEYSGLLRVNVLGKHIFELFPDFEDTTVGHAIKRLLNGQSTHLKTLPFTTRPGYYDLNLIPTFNAEKNQTGAVIFMHDVTESINLKEITIKHRLAQQKQHLQVALQTQEEERKRIAEALHNGLGQLLYGIKLHLEHLKADEGLGAELLNIKGLLEEAIHETRTIAFELMPSILQDFGLEVTLRELSQKLSKTQVCVTLTAYKAAARFSQEVEIAAYRMIQELVNNSLKHSEASQIEIEVYQLKNHLYLQVSDNGKGLDRSALKADMGIGLRSIKKRLKMMGGKLKIEDTETGGTKTRLKLPL